jgi:hypothetical protein
MNIIESLLARVIEARLNDAGQVNKGFPCKVYATKAAAEKATAEAAANVGRLFDTAATSAPYMVLNVEAWGKWVGCINLSEVMRRSTSQGGYLGAEQGFFKF